MTCPRIWNPVASLAFASMALALPVLAAPGPVYAPGACAIDLDHDRPLIPLVVGTPSGGTRVLRCLVDTGGSALLLSAEAGSTLGRGPQAGWRRTTPPPAWCALTPLAWGEIPAFVAPAGTPVVPCGAADAVLPGALLARYRVVLDYPARRFVLAAAAKPAPWTRPAGGIVLPLEAPDASLHPTAMVAVGGVAHRFALDTAAAVTTIAGSVATGAPRTSPWLGHADLDGSGGPGDVLVRLPRLAWGPLTFAAVLAAVGEARHGGAAKQESDPALAGALGGNVLRTLRLEFDPAAHQVVVHVRQAVNATDLDTAGVTLRPRPAGGFDVGGVTEAVGRLGVQPGDELLSIDDLELTAKVGHAVAGNALRGRVGEKRSLVLRRAGRQFTVEAPVVRAL